MRRDMDRVIIDTVRWKTTTKVRRKREKRDPCYWIATEGPMRGCEYYWWTTLGDRLDPLYRYLEKHCGRPWNDVRSDIRASIDVRSIRGYHLWDHVKGMISAELRQIGRASCRERV